MPTTCLPCLARASLALLLASAFSATAAAGSTLWNWSYSGTGITAGGTFTTEDTPDANGAFLITAITGIRNGSLITGLEPPNTAIPGNEPYAVDDLVFSGPGQQLTVDGFGFATADGNFANPFFADFLPSPGISNSSRRHHSRTADRALAIPNFPFSSMQRQCPNRPL